MRMQARYHLYALTSYLQPVELLTTCQTPHSPTLDRFAIFERNSVIRLRPVTVTSPHLLDHRIMLECLPHVVSTEASIERKQRKPSEMGHKLRQERHGVDVSHSSLLLPCPGRTGVF